MTVFDTASDRSFGYVLQLPVQHGRPSNMYPRYVSLVSSTYPLTHLQSHCPSKTFSQEA